MREISHRLQALGLAANQLPEPDGVPGSSTLPTAARLLPVTAQGQRRQAPTEFGLTVSNCLLVTQFEFESNSFFFAIFFRFLVFRREHVEDTFRAVLQETM